MIWSKQKVALCQSSQFRTSRITGITWVDFKDSAKGVYLFRDKCVQPADLKFDGKSLNFGTDDKAIPTQKLFLGAPAEIDGVSLFIGSYMERFDAKGKKTDPVYYYTLRNILGESARCSPITGDRRYECIYRYTVKEERKLQAYFVSKGITTVWQYDGGNIVMWKDGDYKDDCFFVGGSTKVIPAVSLQELDLHGVGKISAMLALSEDTVMIYATRKDDLTNRVVFVLGNMNIPAGGVKWLSGPVAQSSVFGRGF